MTNCVNTAHSIDTLMYSEFCCIALGSNIVELNC